MVIVSSVTCPMLHAQQVQVASVAAPGDARNVAPATTAPAATTPDATIASAPEADTSSSSSLPDAPSAQRPADTGRLVASIPAPAAGEAPKTNVAPKYAKFIASGETAQKINVHDKIIIGARDLYSPENFLAIVFAAGYEQVTNGQPNYGTNSTAFGQRVGAAAVRETSQGVLTDMVFSTILRDDPRYYAQGSDSGFIHRTVYAVTRVLVTKTDSGRATVNAPLLLGYAATAAMTPLYYPQINRNFHDVASGYGGSLGGAAIGFLFSEFSDSVLQTLHLEKKP